MNEQYFPIHTEGMRKAACKVVEGLPVPFEVIIQPIKKKRSNQQNRAYWAFLGDIANQMEVPDESGELSKLTKDDWHDLCRMKWLGVKVINLAGKEYPRPSVSTTKLKVGEFAEYLTKIEAHFIVKGVRFHYTDDYGPALGLE